MPTECERSSSAPNAGVATDTEKTTQHIEPKTTESNTMDKEKSEEMATSTNGHSDTSSTSGRKLSITSADPTAYVAKARITRPTPPPPSYNPMQFVQIKPCNLYQTAQQQLKKAEEVKKIKEIKKEEPEDWQNNLDNWKSSRRKRVEHIIDRVVEVKKLELEEFDRSRRKSKTFSEMIEERGERGVRVGRAKLASLAVYNEDESNDLSDLGIGTSSASGKSSLSEDYDNNSVMSDSADLEKAIFDNNHPQNSSTREYVSSPGYDTSSSTAPASSPDPCEYTYEGAIQDYKQRVSRATSGGSSGFQFNSSKAEYKLTSKEVVPERGTGEPALFEGYPARRGSKIEERLIGFEVNSPNDSQDLAEKSKVDLPKINISKRKEIFENAASKSNNNYQQVPTGSADPKSHSCNGAPRVTLRDHFKLDGAFPKTVQAEGRRLSGDITSIKDRLLSLEQQKNVNPTNDAAKALTTKGTVDIPVLPLKDRLSSLQNAATKEEIKKPPVLLIDARQLEIMKDEEEHAKQRMKQTDVTKTIDTRSQNLCSEEISTESPGDKLLVKNKEAEMDRDDSGIHTSDDIDEQEERNMKPHLLQDTQEQQLNEAIAALAIEEQQLQQAANAVNQIEAEFAELSDTTNMAAAMKSASSAGSDEQPCEMDFSINEALELALEAIDRETATNLTTKTTPNNDHIVENAMETQFFIIQRDEECEAEILCDDLEQQEVNKKIEQIENEPIYENVSTSSTPQVDAEVKITPNHNKISHPSPDKPGKQNNNNMNVNQFVDVTNASPNQMNGLSLLQPHELHSPQPPAPADEEPYYQVPKSSEPYYDAPKHLRPIPVYENIEIFYSGLENGSLESSNGAIGHKMEPPKEKPPPPPTDSPPEFDDVDSIENGGNWSSDNTYETITNRLSNGLAAVVVGGPHPSPPIKRLNSTKRIKKELRHKRSSFLGIEGSADDDLESYLDLTVAPPPDMAKLLQEERRLEKQLYMKAGLCDSSDTGESRDSGVSENHSRQSSEPFTNSSEEADRTDELPLSLITNTTIKPNEVIYQNEAQLLAAQTPLLQTVKGNSAESWTESATVAAAATKSLTEATATANAKMLSIEEKIREQEEVLRVERELLHLEQEELKRQRENLMLRENIARRELQHGAKMLMSANRRSLQDLHAVGVSSIAGFQTASTPASAQVPHQQEQQLHSQQIYANVPNQQQQYYLVDADYRKSMSDLNEFSKRLVLPAPQTAPMPPTKPMRAMQMAAANGPTAYPQHPSPPTHHRVGSLSKNISSVATTSSGQRQTPLALYPNHQLHLPPPPATSNMTRNTLHALSATPKPKYTDGWVQVQNRKSFDSNFSNDPSWLTNYQQKRKSVPEAYMFSSNSSSNNNPRLMQEQEQRRFAEQNRLLSSTSTPMHQQNGGGSTSKCIQNPLTTNNSSNNNNNKPLPDSIIQTLTERLQSKGIGERRRFENYNEKSPLHATSSYQQQEYQQKQKPLQQQQHLLLPSQSAAQRQALEPGGLSNQMTAPSGASTSAAAHDKVLSVSGKKKCSHCGDELGRGAAMIIESLLLFYHINCFKCCVCHVQLGDGLNGTDVRVRNHKLHCQNCYSSDDGIKFSCV